MKKDHISTSHCLPKPLLYDRLDWQTLPDRLPESQDNLGWWGSPEVVWSSFHSEQC